MLDAAQWFLVVRVTSTSSGTVSVAVADCCGCADDNKRRRPRLAARSGKLTCTWYWDARQRYEHSGCVLYLASTDRVITISRKEVYQIEFPCTNYLVPGTRANLSLSLKIVGRRSPIFNFPRRSNSIASRFKNIDDFCPLSVVFRSS
jgi:hypothetical protein